MTPSDGECSIRLMGWLFENDWLDLARVGSSPSGVDAVFNKQDDWPSLKTDKFNIDDGNW